MLRTNSAGSTSGSTTGVDDDTPPVDGACGARCPAVAWGRPGDQPRQVAAALCRPASTHAAGMGRLTLIFVRRRRSAETPAAAGGGCGRAHQ